MPSTEHLVDSLYVALQTFYIAVTVERCYEMAMSLSRLGMAHRWVTQTVEIMTQCYRHATQCAEWHGDSELATFLRDAHANLERERRAGEGT